MSCPGYAVIQVRDRQPRLITAGHVKTNAKKSHGYRLKQIQEMLVKLRREYGYNAVIRERGFSRFPSVTQTLFKVVGLSDLVFNSFDIVEIPPTTVKKLVTGNGKADKKDVEQAVRTLLRLGPNVQFATDDESDAAAVCLAYLLREGHIADG